MSAEPFIIFFLLRSVRKIFRNTAIGEAWGQKIMIIYMSLLCFLCWNWYYISGTLQNGYGMHF